MKNITKNAKTILFAGLIAAMIFPFGGISQVNADVNNPHDRSNDSAYREVTITVDAEKQRIIEKIASIGEKLDNTSNEEKIERLQDKLDNLKPKMLEHQLTPNFDFGEDVQEWEQRFEEPTIQTRHSNNGDWRVVHELKWGCNSWVYCHDRWPEYVDLNDWSSISWNMPTLYIDNGHIKHFVENHSSSSQTETMNGWGTHSSGTTVVDNNSYSKTQFWLNHEVEDEVVLQYDNASTGDRLYSTIRVT